MFRHMKSKRRKDPQGAGLPGRYGGDRDGSAKQRMSVAFGAGRLPSPRGAAFSPPESRQTSPVGALHPIVRGACQRPRAASTSLVHAAQRVASRAMGVKQ